MSWVDNPATGYNQDTAEEKTIQEILALNPHKNRVPPCQFFVQYIAAPFLTFNNSDIISVLCFFRVHISLSMSLLGGYAAKIPGGTIHADYAIELLSHTVLATNAQAVLT